MLAQIWGGLWSCVRAGLIIAAVLIGGYLFFEALEWSLKCMVDACLAECSDAIESEFGECP